METKDSAPFLQEQAVYLYPEPDEFHTLLNYSFFINFNII